MVSFTLRRECRGRGLSEEELHRGCYASVSLFLTLVRSRLSINKCIKASGDTGCEGGAATHGSA